VALVLIFSGQRPRRRVCLIVAIVICNCPSIREFDFSTCVIVGKSGTAFLLVDARTRW